MGSKYPPTAGKCRVLLVDDHKILREALRWLLEREEDIQVVGEAGDGEEALGLAGQAGPDMVVMDVGLPHMNGIEATRRLVAENPRIRVLALSVFEEPRVVLEMLEAGASGYVVKSDSAEELLRAIRAVARGDTYLCPEVAGAVVETVRAKHAQPEPEKDPLGRREREVLALVAEGRTSAEISSSLHIAINTVEVHRRNIMRKLGLHSVAELTKYAIRHGLTPG
ncbi:MAG: response regulator transcription factor [Rhodocyclales bacterium]|nr:response regulator transcription factor [Rhodocyclales bacterium]